MRKEKEILVNFKIDPDVHKKFKSKCEKKGYKMGGLLRRWITQGIEKEEKNES